MVGRSLGCFCLVTSHIYQLSPSWVPVRQVRQVRIHKYEMKLMTSGAKKLPNIKGPIIDKQTLFIMY